MRKRRLWTAVTVLALLLAGGLSAQPVRADVYTVTTTFDSGSGSLRWAIEQANSNPGDDVIAFNIPTSDTGYKPVTGVWTIQPLSPLPYLTDGGTSIDGTTQPAFSGAPIIEIEGTKAGAGAGLRIESANNTIKGLVINRFIMQGILLYGSGASGNVISGNYIGTDATGASGPGNQATGVQIAGGAHDNNIGGTASEERNLIAGNDHNGVEISGAYDNLITGNYIGTDASSMVALGNGWSGVSINLGAQGNVIGGITSEEGNVISGNGSRGVYIYASGTVSNTISGNYIGTDATGTGALGNQLGGIYIGEPNGGAQGNTIGPGNVIAHNGGNGIWVDGPDTTGNKVTQNSITDNANLGIDNFNGGNTELLPPAITSVTAGLVSGIACPNCTVEIFSDPEDEGGFYEATVVADGSGDFSWTGSVTGPYVTATATDAAGNTSEFSCRVPLMSYAVINTNDSGPGSLPWAVEQANANPGPDTIVFNIPPSDPGYNHATHVWTIRPLSPLPTLTDGGTTIDGTTQTTSQGDTNPYGPEIEMDGTSAGATNGLMISSAGNNIRGLAINRFALSAVMINGSGVTANSISNNYLGTDATGTVDLGNGASGVTLSGSAQGNTIEDNLISGNDDIGVHALEAGTNDNVIRGNNIGTDASGTAPLPNERFGVAFFNGPQNNIVGPDNVVAYNGLDGVLVDGADSFTSTVGNTITANSITGNGGQGISNFRGGNIELTPPIINTVTASHVSGTACAQCRVEIFSDPEDEGQKYEGATIADEAGNWTWSGLATGPNVTATATDGAGNTSEFSSPTVVYRVYMPIVLKSS
jgi:hypothetical protein